MSLYSITARSSGTQSKMPPNSMRLLKHHFAFILRLAFLVSVSVVFTTAAELTPGEKKVRDNYYLGDRELVVLDAKPYIDEGKASLRLRAFYFHQAVGTPGFEWSSWWKLMPVLEGMKKEAPNDPWTLVAQSSNATTTAERLSLCRKAIAANEDQDILVLCTDTMVFPFTVNLPGSDIDDLAAFLDAYGNRLEGTADSLCAKGLATFWLANKRKDDKATAKYFEDLDRILKIDSRHERTLQLKAGQMINQRKFRDVVDMLGPVLSNGARSAVLHRPYNNSINQLDIPAGEKARLMEADIMRLLDTRLPGGSLLSTLSGLLKSNSEDAARRVAEAVIARYPDTYGSEMMKVALITAQIDTYKVSETKPDDLRRDTGEKLLSYLKEIRSKVNFNSLALVAGIDAADSGLRRTFLGAQGPEGIATYQLLAALTALRNDYARSVVALELLKRRAHIIQIKTKSVDVVDRLTALTRSNVIEWQLIVNGKDLEESHWENLARWHQVAGYADLQLGNVAGAERSLRLAEKLNPYLARDVVLNSHIAELEIAKREFDRAEDRLNKSLELNWGANSEHPALVAFRKLYAVKNKNSAGLDKYMSTLLEKDRSRRKIKVLASRIKNPKEFPPFSLTTHDGKSFSSLDLKGKVTVINFWGVWCAPCILEMPEMQKLYDAYKGDPRVAIVTIDSGDSLNTLKAYLEKNRYTFPVLREGDYIKTAEIKSFPTTWFLDANGRIAFEKMGRTIDLEAEFGWRIEALLEKGK